MWMEICRISELLLQCKKRDSMIQEPEWDSLWMKKGRGTDWLWKDWKLNIYRINTQPCTHSKEKNKKMIEPWRFHLTMNGEKGTRSKDTSSLFLITIIYPISQSIQQSYNEEKWWEIDSEGNVSKTLSENADALLISVQIHRVHNSITLTLIRNINLNYSRLIWNPLKILFIMSSRNYYEVELKINDSQFSISILSEVCSN